MTALTRQPTNINMLGQLGGRMILKRAPTTNFFVQVVTIPPVQLGVADYLTGLDTIPLPGDSLVRGTLDVSFKVDEDVKNYLEIYHWMIGLGYPDSHDQYAAISTRAKTLSGEGVMSDITITIANSAQRANLEFRFQDAFPVSLSGLRFNTRDEQMIALDVEVNFKFRHFTVHDAETD